jgi:hypothetical protein
VRKSKVSAAFRSNVKCARAMWGEFSKIASQRLKELTETYDISVAAGDLRLLDGRWYVTHAGLLRIAKCNRCAGIRTIVQRDLSDPPSSRWVFKAIAYRTSRSQGFVGYGDAEPSNVSPLVRGSEMRVAETRAVNRALRKAYRVGLCSVEELGWEPKTYSPSQQSKAASSANSNGHQNGHASLRDRLCLLIRQHQLDANLVKSYAADSCGTPNLRDATREQIENFITNLSDWAAKDRPALLCKLNSYAAPHEVSS